jgi:hypothetical protein
MELFFSILQGLKILSPEYKTKKQKALIGNQRYIRLSLSLVLLVIIKPYS